ncbi:MAG: hypothetical protein RI949_2714 [Pseudomonadota bacterium]|jgi:hypothetical protein
MSGKTKVIISISEFIEPRDFGEIAITCAGRVLARKSNVPLYGANPNAALEFMEEKIAKIRDLGDVELVFENVDEGLRSRILALLG